jgi:hypothetical protein
VLHDTRAAERDAIKGVAQDRKIVATRFRDNRFLAFTIEELETERLLERLDLMAHCTLRDAELLRGSGEALMPRGRFEGLKGIQRRQATKHRAPAASVSPVCCTGGFASGRRAGSS